MLVAAEAGRAALPLPLTTTLLASRVLSRVPQRAQWSEVLHQIASGKSSITFALRGSPEDWSGEKPSVVAERNGGAWSLTGSQAFVPYGPLADLMLVEADISTGGRSLFLLPTGDKAASWESLDVIDKTEPQFLLTLEEASVANERCLYQANDGDLAIEAQLDEWRAAIAAETLGLCEKMLELCVAYAKERVQFDRPIGANQAVKARIAEMGAHVERMRAAVYHAAVKIQDGAEDRPLAVAMAKAATSAPGNFVASQAVHVHGGIGYTWEHDLHIYFKRVKSNELLLGDEQASLARVAAVVL
jgi:alkylation response protein AidB-like acyl-CoA dehydrogenase